MILISTTSCSLLSVKDLLRLDQCSLLPAELTKAKINICEERSDEDSHDRDKADKTGDVETLQTGAANDPGCLSNLLTAPFQIQ